MEPMWDAGTRLIPHAALLFGYITMVVVTVNLLKMKLRLLYLKTQFVPRCKHFIWFIKTNQFVLFVAKVAVCSQINTKHINTLRAQRTVVEC